MYGLYSSGWVHKRCTDVNSSLARVEDTFACKVFADDREDNGVDESMNLECIWRMLKRFVIWRIC